MSDTCEYRSVFDSYRDVQIQRRRLSSSPGRSINRKAHSMSATLSSVPYAGEQRRQALQIANTVRHERSIIKRDLKAGRRSMIGLLADPPAYLQTMKVIDLLIALPRHGRVTASATLSRAMIPPAKTVGALTRRQRSVLIAALTVTR